MSTLTLFNLPATKIIVAGGTLDLSEAKVSLSGVGLLSPEEYTLSVNPAVNSWSNVLGNHNTVITASYELVAPGPPVNLESSLIADEAPGIPGNLQSTLVDEAPGIPDNLQSTLVPDAVPGTPGNLQSVLTTDVPTEPIPGVSIPLTGQAAVVHYGSSYYIDSDNNLNLLGNTFSYTATPTAPFRYYIPQHIASDVKSIHSGIGAVMFYEKTDGSVHGFGLNFAHVLSETVRAGTYYATNPVLQNFGADFLKVSSWIGNVIVLKTDGSMWGRGINSFNNLGLSSDSEQQTLVQIEANSVIDISCGDDSTLFVKSDNKLFGVGGNNYGSLGLGHKNYLGSAASAVEITTGVSKCYSNERSSYFIKTDGQLFGMGDAVNGSLGQGNSIDRSSPVFIDSNVSEAFPGNESLLYIKNDNTLWGFGKGLTESPVQYATDVVSASSGNSNGNANQSSFIFQKSDSSLWGWGYNSGELGPQNGKNEFDGTTYNNPVTLKRSA